jgi:hypothetical protein
MYHIFKFKNKISAQTFDYLLKSANFNYTITKSIRGDRKKTVIYEFIVKLDNT